VASSGSIYLDREWDPALCKDTPQSSNRRQFTDCPQKVVDLWEGRITSNNDALRLLLIVDYIFDWARDIYRETIIGELRTLSASDNPSSANDSDIFSTIDRIAIWPQGVERALGRATEQSEIGGPSNVKDIDLRKYRVSSMEFDNGKSKRNRHGTIQKQEKSNVHWNSATTKPRNDLVIPQFRNTFTTTGTPVTSFINRHPPQSINQDTYIDLTMDTAKAIATIHPSTCFRNSNQHELAGEPRRPELYMIPSRKVPTAEDIYSISSDSVYSVSPEVDSKPTRKVPEPPRFQQPTQLSNTRRLATPRNNTGNMANPTGRVSTTARRHSVTSSSFSSRSPFMPFRHRRVEEKEGGRSSPRHGSKRRRIEGRNTLTRDRL
jgi:hypothetical protein